MDIIFLLKQLVFSQAISITNISSQQFKRQANSLCIFSDITFTINN